MCFLTISRSCSPPQAPASNRTFMPHLIEAAEHELVSQAIKLAHGNQARATRWLGISRLTMREKLQRFGLHPAQESGQEHR